ncbi:MAG: helix-turn-helix domain-containing protein [Lentisphaeria bacterium]
MYLNIIELAESLGVAEKVIQEWIRSEGLPCIRDGMRMSFDRAQVVAWAEGRGLAAKAGFLAAKAQVASHELSLADLLRVGGIWRAVPGGEIFPIMERTLSRLSDANPAVVRLLTQRLRTPQGMNWAPMGGGLAMPHLSTHVTLGRHAGGLAILLLREPAPLPEPPPDGVAVKELLFFIAPSPRAHLQLVGQLSAHLLHGRLKALLDAAAPDEAILAALAEPPPDPEPKGAGA